MASETAVIPDTYWTSRGRNQLYAEEMVNLQQQLMQWTSTLKLRPRVSELFVEISPNCHHLELAEDVLLHDDILLPLWKDFSEAISAVTENAYRCFLVIIQDVQLSRPVLDLLAPALNQAPIGGLLMRNNRLPRDGIRFVSKFVELNASLKCLAACNKIESELDAISLAQAVRRHPNIESLILHQVGLGQRQNLMAAIIPALRNSTLEAVSLGHNQIGSEGAAIISDFLSSNPTLKTLHLDRNLLKDDDMVAIAESLGKNTNLEEINLHQNKYGMSGANALLKAVCNRRSLNSIHDSNHTCHVKLDYNLLRRGKPLTEDESNIIFNVNERPPNERRNAKILHTLDFLHLRAVDTQYMRFRHLNGVPIQLMPRVLALFQDETSSLDPVFQVMREWKMPSLYVNWCRCSSQRRVNISKRRRNASEQLVPLRRSDRLRKITKR